MYTTNGESLIRMPLAELSAQLDTELLGRSIAARSVNAVASTRRDLGGRVFVRLKDGKTSLRG